MRVVVNGKLWITVALAYVLALVLAGAVLTCYCAGQIGDLFISLCVYILFTFHS